MLNFNKLKKARVGAVLGLGLMLLVLNGCGGGGDKDLTVGTTAASGSETKSASALPRATPTETLLQKGAALNNAELARAEVAAANQSASQKSALKGAAKAGTKAAANPNQVTVWRFFNSQTLAHFYTASETEKAVVMATLPQFSLDGPAFAASTTIEAGLSPVHRFFNTQTGVHFFTISEDERALVQSSMPQFTYDGVAYYASKVAGAGLSPLYRFYLTTKGFHFYSNSEAERDTIVATLPQYKLEGVGYYVAPPPVVVPSTLKLPHSGVTDQQCFQQAGVSSLGACSSAEALALNPQQDGHRATINPMAYLEVPKPGGGNYARTECVIDSLTHKVWEGKPASGPRSASNRYTNLDDPAQPQHSDGRYPTQEEIGAASNSVGYVNYVNSIALCGFQDWRLPTRRELQGIYDYSRANPGPVINTDWFPNTESHYALVSSPFVANAAFGWNLSSFTGGVGTSQRDFTNYYVGALRLVRSNQ